MSKENDPGLNYGSDNEQGNNPNYKQGFDQTEDADQPADAEIYKKWRIPYKELARWLVLGVSVLVAITVVAFLFSGISKKRFAENSIQETGGLNESSGSSTTEDEVDYLGILPLQNPTVMVNQFSEVEKFLNENTSLNVELRLYPTTGELGGYTAVVKDISEGKISFAYLASVTTVQANGNGPVVPFVCAQKEGSPTYRGDLVVKVDSPYNTLEDLKGKKVSGTSKSSTSGNLMPSAWLKSLNIDPDTYFEGGMMYLGSHDKAIEAVIKGSVDGAFINESTKNKFNKDVEVVRSIWRHDPVPEFPFVVNTEKVTATELAEVKSALLKMHETNQSGIQNIEPGYEKWVAINWEDYLGIKSAIDGVYGPVFYDLEKWGE